jgi:hypothetical protein
LRLNSAGIYPTKDLLSLIEEVSLILGSDAVYITAGKLPGNSKKNIELRLPYDKVVTPSRASNLLLYDTIQGYITG